jgi:tetratricopeptide (TPR) repeat protein
MRPSVLRACLPAIAAALLLLGCASPPRGRDLALEYYAIGNAWLDLGRYEKALDAFRSALRLDPALVKADYNLALTYARMRSTADAESILNRLLADDPRNVTLLSTLAWAYHLGGRDGEALAAYDRVLAIAPESVDAWYNSALILWKGGKKEEALVRTRRMLALSPEDPQGLLAAGSLLLESGDAASAEDFLGRYVQKRPDDMEGRYLLAQALESQRAFARAIAAYDGILGRDQKQAGAWFGKARLLLTVVEDPERGLEGLRRAIALGFADKEAARALLASEGLKEAGSVESALTEAGLLP